jgi:hypothetical protein
LSRGKICLDFQFFCCWFGVFVMVRTLETRVARIRSPHEPSITISTSHGRDMSRILICARKCSYSFSRSLYSSGGQLSATSLRFRPHFTIAIYGLDQFRGPWFTRRTKPITQRAHSLDSSWIKQVAQVSGGGGRVVVARIIGVPSL